MVFMAKFCHSCGAQLADDAQFCAACGAKQQAAETAPAAQESQPAAPVATAPAPKKGGKGGLIAGLFTIAAAIALVLIGVLYVWPNFLSRDARYDKYMEKAEALCAAENYAGALEQYSRAVKLDTGRADPYLGRGDAYAAQDELDDAIEDYKTAVALEPARADGYLKLADAYVAAGDTDAARAALQSGLDEVDDEASLSRRLAELSSPLAGLEAALGELADFAESSPTGQALDIPAVADVAAAMAKTGEAVNAARAASPMQALSVLGQALTAGQTSVAFDLSDGENSARLQADLCTDLAAGEASLTGSVAANGEMYDLTAYLSRETGAFRSGLIGEDWYGVTWATLLDDLSDSIFVRDGYLSQDDLDELRSQLAQAGGLGESLGALDFSGLDWKKYASVLFSAAPGVTSGTDETGRTYLTVSLDMADSVGIAADLLETAAADAALRELLASVCDMTGDADTAAELRADWASTLQDAADELRSAYVSGTIDLTICTRDGYVDSIRVSGAPSVDGETMTIDYTVSYAYDDGALSRIGLDATVRDDVQGMDSTVRIGYRVAPEGDRYASDIAFSVTDGVYGGTTAGVLSTVWDRRTGELSFSIESDGDVISTESFLPLTLTSGSDGAELRCDLSALMDMDAGLTLAAYPGESYVDRPKSFVSIRDWDEDTLDRFEEAVDQLAALFGGVAMY